MNEEMCKQTDCYKPGGSDSLAKEVCHANVSEFGPIRPAGVVPAASVSLFTSKQQKANPPKHKNPFTAPPNFRSKRNFEPSGAGETKS